MPELLYETEGPVATITLNRPERLNAVTPELVDLLDEALAGAQADSAVRVIRLRGAGRAFCAGYDLNWAAAYSDRMLVMQRGALALDATPAEVMQPERIRELFGFDAEAVEAGGRAWLVPRV